MEEALIRVRIGEEDTHYGCGLVAGAKIAGPKLEY